MAKINTYPIKLKQAEGKQWIFDHCRAKWLILTPEERVRQFFLHYLVETKHYPIGLIATEMPLDVNGQRRRSDIVVFRQAVPFLVVECKAPAVPLDQSVADQAAAYNHALQVAWVAITNGRQTYCYHRPEAQANWLAVPELPHWQALR